MNNEVKIAAVVITYNRLEFLKELLQALKSQSYKLDAIIVVNNGSTDGTAQWLRTQTDLNIITQENLGSSGGQYTAIKTAYDLGYDYIWTMDDDVIPDNNCLKNLMEDISPEKIHTPLRHNPDKIPFENDVKHFNLTNPFKSLWNGVLKFDDLHSKKIELEGITFEGPLFHRNLIQDIGLPEKKFFIHGDDSEFFIRAKKKGYKIYLITSAKSYRKLKYIDPDIKFSWKHYYIIRNIIAIDVLHGNLPVRLIRPFAYLVKWLTHVRSFKELKVTLKAFINGYFYKSENQNNIPNDMAK